MRRHLQIYRVLLRNSLIREMNFAVNFWLWMVCEALWFIAQILLIEVVFLYTDSIAGWNKWQVVMLYGTHHLVGQLFQSVAMVNLANVGDLIRTGRMDFLLLQPVNSQFAATTRQFGFDNLGNAFLGLAFVVFACWKLHFVPTAGQVLLYILAVLLATLIHYGITCMLVTISFWVVKAQGFIHGYYSLMNMARYPDAIFLSAPKLLQIVLTLVIPVTLVANVPTRLFNDITTGFNLWISAALFLFVSFWIFAASVKFWNFALRHYTSASS